MRIGQGFDSHRLVAGRPLVLAGEQIPHGKGLEGHSDGDVVLHAVADAILGALGEGDLGRHFPSSDAALAGAASRQFIERVVGMIQAAGLEIANLDCTLIAEAPRLAPHQEAMESTLSELLGVPRARVNLKLKSNDGMGALGREEGMAALAVVLLVAADG
ncbi:MAG: 2-C-methyl-D-erythritol 2,4-cyclodiphosphate synthase [Myxococcota bacterium]|nr:2-C-methyl-D-erythritol 2,4-cyclodiphosphate synthase [Myxococcota bacterium]